MKVGIYPGSFDPVTNGHLDIIQRASKLVDKLIVAVLFNPNKSNALFSVEDRVQMLKESVSHIRGVEIDSFSGLLVEYATTNNISVIIKGLRTVTDFEYEMQMAQVNKHIAPKVETIFMITDAKYSYLSSSVIKEMVHFDANINNLVPEVVEKKFKNMQR